jgi:hypothetical protein
MVNKTADFFSATGIDEQEKQTRQEIEWIVYAHTEAIKLIAESSLDNFVALFLANGHSTQMIGFVLGKYSARQREWSYVVAAQIRDAHYAWKAHAVNIVSGLGQLGLAGYGLYKMQGAGNNMAAIEVAKGWQTKGTAIGHTGGTVYSLCDSSKQGHQAELQGRQGILNTERQQSDTAQVKQQAQQALEKSGQADQARHQAFGEFAR